MVTQTARLKDFQTDGYPDVAGAVAVHLESPAHRLLGGEDRIRECTQVDPSVEHGFTPDSRAKTISLTVASPTVGFAAHA